MRRAEWHCQQQQCPVTTVPGQYPRQREPRAESWLCLIMLGPALSGFSAFPGFFLHKRYAEAISLSIIKKSGLVYIKYQAQGVGTGSGLNSQIADDRMIYTHLVI